MRTRALCTDITEVNLSAFVCRLFHDDFFMKQSVDKYKRINFCNLYAPFIYFMAQEQAIHKTIKNF